MKIFGDSNRICLILSSLIGNSIKYTERGSITVKVSSVDTHCIQFEVIDTGHGISI